MLGKYIFYFMKNFPKINSVMVVAKHLIYGGTERYTLNLVNSLTERGIKVVLVTGSGPLLEYISPQVKIYVLPISRKSRIKELVEKKIAEITLLHKPQLIHTQCRTSMMVSQLARQLLQIPLITHEHHMYNQQDYPFIVSELNDGSDKIITVGPYTRRALIKYGYDKNKIVSLVNGINISDFPTISNEERQLYRKQLNIQDFDKVVVCISRVVRGKGLDKLIMGFRSVSRKVKNAKLLIVGDDEEHNNTKLILRQMISRFKIQKYVSVLPGEFYIRKYHAVADVFCYPALSKGMAVMEAMAVGLPVVGKRTDKKPLMVENMVSGLMTEPTKLYKIDPKQIAEKLTYLLDNPEVAQKMGSAGRKRIETKYNLDDHLGKLTKVYQDLITSHKLHLKHSVKRSLILKHSYYYLASFNRTYPSGVGVREGE